MLPSGIIVSVDPDGASAALVTPGRVPEVSYTVLTTVDGCPIEQTECVIIFDTVKHLPD